MEKKELFEWVINYFQKEMPIAETELEYINPYQLLVATILSAQCTDKRVNLITPELFRRFPTPEKLAMVESAEVFDYIRSCSYPNNKAKHLVGMARMLVSDFGGLVPDDIDELQKLPGVGRKTANVIASVVYNKPTMAVDTHVFRVAARIGLSTNSTTPFETEKQLVKYFPEELIPLAHHWLILHGRYTCLARSPKCEKCGLKVVCSFYCAKSGSNEQSKI
ncbi:MAG: endonuclease III [Bacteroidota bacterium]|nr:endonuclease III [Odoribacter sp.]MDP3641723.1 endonuclease III [Bacteroidota bacterium]